MYETLTVEQIKTNILNRLTTGLQTREGSYTNDVISAAAAEIAECYHSLDALVPSFYLDETSGEYIDRQAAVVGIARKEGGASSCVIRFTGSDGASIPAGTPFYTEAGLAFDLDEEVTISAGSGVGRLTCQDVGLKGNIGPGEITQTLRNYSGIDSYANEAAAGGVDRESDGALLERLLARLRRVATSGNPYHYQQWADSVEGVGTSRVIAKWNGAGTVKVVLAGQDFGPAPEDVVTACGTYIESQRPVGAAVTVTAAQGVELAVTATVSIDGTTTKGKVQTAFQAALAAYLAGLVKTAFTRNLDGELDDVAGQRYTVSYNRVSALLLSVPGVIDHTALTVAGGTANVSVPADGVPVLTEVRVT